MESKEKTIARIKEFTKYRFEMKRSKLDTLKKIVKDTTLTYQSGVYYYNKFMRQEVAKHDKRKKLF
jgi:hypothetical protein